MNKTISRRYLKERSEVQSGEWDIFDVLKQQRITFGLSLEEAEEAADRLNKKWDTEKANILAEQVPLEGITLP